VLWNLYSCCGAGVCVVEFAFVLWRLVFVLWSLCLCCEGLCSCCGVCICVEPSGPPYYPDPQVVNLKCAEKEP